MIKSVRFAAIFTLFFALNFRPAFAEFARSTSFNDRESCEKTKGVWREFGNSLGDSCEGKFDQFAIAPQVVTYSCDCGKNKCWNGDRCVLMQEYKKIFDQRQQRDREKIEAAKRARSEEYRENSNERLESLIAKSNPDPNNQNPNNNMGQFRDKLPAIDQTQAAKNNSRNGANNQGKIVQQPPIVKILDLPDNQNNKITDVPAEAVTVIPTTPDVVNPSSTNAGPTPFFLQQQEKAKQEAGANGSTTNKSVVAPDLGLPGLPQIPLPQ